MWVVSYWLKVPGEEIPEIGPLGDEYIESPLDLRGPLMAVSLLLAPGLKTEGGDGTGQGRRRLNDEVKNRGHWWRPLEQPVAAKLLALSGWHILVPREALLGALNLCTSAAPGLAT